MGFFDRIKKWLGIENKDVSKGIPRDDYSYNELEAKKKEQVDALLDKISKKGIQSLTQKEKSFLDRESKR